MTESTTPIVLGSLLAVALLAAGPCHLRQSLPFPEADRLVVLQETDADGTSLSVAYDTYVAWRDSTPGLESVSAHVVTDLRLDGDKPRDVRAARSTVDLFQTLGVAPVLGRTFVEGDRQRSVAVLSYELWQDRFSSRPDIIGGSVTLDDQAHTVIGVLPGGARYPVTADVWTLLQPAEVNDEHALTVTARLSPGVGPEQAERSLNEVDLPCGHGADVVPFRETLSAGGDAG